MTVFSLTGVDPVTLAVYLALAGLSIAALTAVLVKLVQFARLKPGREAQAQSLLAEHLAGRLVNAAPAAGAQGRVLSAISQALRETPQDRARAEECGRQAAMAELGQLGASMRVLEAAVQGAPMLGLLGTVIGMIDAFSALAQSGGVADPSQLAGGIWTALATTAIGLAIALVFYFVALWFEGRIEREQRAMEILISAAVHALPPSPGPGR